MTTPGDSTRVVAAIWENVYCFFFFFKVVPTKLSDTESEGEGEESGISQSLGICS